MPRQKISAKYHGENGEYFNGIPARDLTEDEFDALTDDQKATLAAEPPEGVKRLYTLRHDAPAEAEKATKRLHETDAQTVVIDAPMTGGTVAISGGPATPVETTPKGDGAKK